jgi:hypothetical protein
MKRLFLILSVLVLGLFLFTQAQAAPLLVCDPAPVADQVTYVQVTTNGTAGTLIPYATQTIGGTTYCVVQDLATLAVGNYTVTAKFRNAWGDSVASSPFTFTKALPAAPSGMAIK